MPTPSFPFLSPFDRTTPGGPSLQLEAGKWQRADDLLGRIAAATDLGKLRHLNAVKSIPGIWAHASTFFDLWKGDGSSVHPLGQLRNEAMASWRGLLALVALAESSKLPVLLRAIYPDTSRPFLRKALPQCPRVLLQTGDGANDAALTSRLGYLLYADKPDGPYRVAGLLTPATMVLPARDFAAPRHPRIGWVRSDNDGSSGAYPLIDPASCDRLPSKQRDALVAMVRHWRAQTEALSASTSKDSFNRPLYPLIEALSSFLLDLTENAPPQRWKYEPTDRQPSDDGDGDGPAFAVGPVAYLKQAPRHVSDAPAKDLTDCALVMYAAPGAQSAKILIYADSFCEDPLDSDGVEPVIWRDLTVRETSEALVRADLSGPDGPLTKGWCLFTTRELFSSRLIKLENPSSAGSIDYPRHGPLNKYLLPLTPAALLVVPPGELGARLSVEDNEDGSTTVSLKVTTISSTGIQRNRYVRRRFYDREKALPRAVEPPRLAIWPNLDSDDWNNYFVYQEHDNRSFEVVGAVTRRSARAPLEMPSETDADKPDVSLHAKIVAREDFDDVSPEERKVATKKTLFSYDSVPEALICRVEEHIGLLLIGLERAPPLDHEVKWRIAIDYGTTNTSIAYRPLSAEARAAQPLVLEDRTHLPMVGASDERRNSLVYYVARYNFISPEAIQSPFLTLLHRRPTSSAGVDLVGGTNAIAFATDYDWLDQIKNNPGKYFFGVKWQVDATTSVESFVKQLTLQACAEARARGVLLENISWSFTIPASLNEPVSAKYQDVVNNTIRNLYSLKKTRRHHIDFPLESAAALTYMMYMSRNSVGLAQVVLDVGGHSTDISVHRIGHAEAIWEGSVEIGGRDILIEDWISDPKRWTATRGLLETYGRATDNLFGTTKLEALSDRETQRILMEMLINRDGLPNETQALSASGEAAAALILRVNQRADFVFYALCDYVICILVSLKEAGHPIDVRAGLNFCGRGSKLLCRARQPFGAASVGMHGQSDRDALVRRFEGFSAATREAHGTELFLDTAAFSNIEHAKLEVALGAAAMSHAPDFTSARARYPLPQGERLDLLFSAGAEQRLRTIEPGEAIEKEIVKRELFDYRMPKNNGAEDLPAFRGFLARYSQSLDIAPSDAPVPVFPVLQLPLEIISGAAAEFDKSLKDAREAANPAGFVQPMFTATVRASLDRWDKLVTTRD